MRTLAFLKTHKINSGIIDEFCKLKSSGVDALLVIDNKDKFYPDSGIVEYVFYGRKIKCLLTDFECYEECNLPGYYDNKDNLNYNRFMWYNSDYPMYAVYKYFPDYDYYWQIEYDVFCNGKNYKPFFGKYRHDNADLIVTRFNKAAKAWWATEKTDWIWNDEIIKCCCILPVLRISNRALLYLYNKRIEHGKIYKQNISNENVRWLYCEIFTATEIANNPNFTAKELVNQYISDKPVINLAENRIFLKQDNKLYHPVR